MALPGFKLSLTDGRKDFKVVWVFSWVVTVGRVRKNFDVFLRTLHPLLNASVCSYTHFYKVKYWHIFAAERNTKRNQRCIFPSSSHKSYKWMSWNVLLACQSWVFDNQTLINMTSGDADSGRDWPAIETCAPFSRPRTGFLMTQDTFFELLSTVIDDSMWNRPFPSIVFVSEAVAKCNLCRSLHCTLGSGYHPVDAQVTLMPLVLPDSMWLWGAIPVLGK